MTDLKPTQRDVEEAVAYFKTVNPHMAADEYYLQIKHSHTSQAYLAGLLSGRKSAEALANALEKKIEHWHSHVETVLECNLCKALEEYYKNNREI